ncbi:hypothetical protein PHET_03350 [Paragonimus heterotremus]|uniref:Nanos-type domain-containing protein n=1 Tax=Paragonimus heterotremus TaxID=100268 RepID=A0A8J4T113_9TREM|nr:hypothetical protein PHET_03350 [Paragonimus heterotremus]
MAHTAFCIRPPDWLPCPVCRVPHYSGGLRCTQPDSQARDAVTQCSQRAGSAEVTRLEDECRYVDYPLRIIRHVHNRDHLSPAQLFSLADFLGQLASWCQRLSETYVELCVFCRNNNAPYELYTTHKVKDRFGRVTCPVLRQFTCPICGGTGDRAHTIRYCPRMGQSTSSNLLPCPGNSVFNEQPASGPSQHLIRAGLLDPAVFFQ